MSVLFFSQHAALYGANQSLLTIVKGLKKRNIDSVVITSKEGPLNRVLRENHIKTFVLPFEAWIYRSNEKYYVKRVKNKITTSIKNIIANKKLTGKIEEIIKNNDIKLIYSNSTISNIGYFVSRKYKLPHIWHLREFVDLDFGFHWRFGKTISRWIINTADTVIAVSNSVKKHHLPHRKIGVHTQVIYDGVVRKNHFCDVKKLEDIEKKDKQMFVFALIGSISPAKGQLEAINALHEVHKTHKNVRLVLMGKGNPTELMKRAADLSISHCVGFYGHVQNIYDHFHEIDAVLVCSRHEGFGMVTVEAMAAKKPVIARNTGGPGEVIRHGETGLLYKGGYTELANEMIKLIDDTKLREKIAITGFEEAKKFTKEEFSDKIKEIISDYLNVQK